MSKITEAMEEIRRRIGELESCYTSLETADAILNPERRTMPVVSTSGRQANPYKVRVTRKKCADEAVRAPRENTPTPPLRGKKGRGGPGGMAKGAVVDAIGALKEPFTCDDVAAAIKGAQRADSLCSNWTAKGWLKRAGRGLFQRTKAFPAAPRNDGMKLLEEIHQEIRAGKDD